MTTLSGALLEVNSIRGFKKTSEYIPGFQMSAFPMKFQIRLQPRKLVTPQKLEDMLRKAFGIWPALNCFPQAGTAGHCRRWVPRMMDFVPVPFHLQKYLPCVNKSQERPTCQTNKALRAADPGGPPKPSCQLHSPDPQGTEAPAPSIPNAPYQTALLGENPQGDCAQP